ncbi:MAG: flagellar export chaperone FliS [Clostridiales bacterium]|nr:flagellar export chaperone FliS [Clostridiales bacterium]
MDQKNFKQYKLQSINTMTQGEMLITLYDELIKRLKQAELALEDDDKDVYQDCIARSVRIIQYLKNTLRREFEISRNLNALYDYFIYELGRASARRNEEIIGEVRSFAQELRDSFRQASRLAEF